MKWKNHRMLTGSVAFALTGHVIPMMLAMTGSTLPNQVEGSEYDSVDWYLAHRTWSHFWPLWMTPCALSYWYLGSLSLHVDRSVPELLRLALDYPITIGMPWALYAIFWVTAGALLHILEDMPCGGVPIWKPKQRIGHRLFYVGSALEYLFAYGTAFAAVGIRYLAVGQENFFLGL